MICKSPRVLHRRLLEAERRAGRLARQTFQVPQDEDLPGDGIQPRDSLVHRVHQSPPRERRLRTEVPPGDLVGLVDALAERPSLPYEGPEQAQAGVAHHGEQPGQGARRADNVWAHRQAGERLLDRVLGVLGITADAQAEPVDPVVVRVHEERERLIVAAGRREELLIVGAHR